MATYDTPDKCAKHSDKETTGPDKTDIWNTTHLLDPGDKLGLLLRLVISLHIKPQLAQPS